MHRFIKSLINAFRGWRFFFTTERNGRIQAVLGVVAVTAGFVLHLDTHGWIALLFCIALVLCLEMTNSAIEKLIDHLHPQQHEQIKWIKDVAAGAVLLATAISLVMAALIFTPKIILLF